jgi:hypothetical protein
LKGRKPRHANASESARTSTRSFGCAVVDREVEAGDRRERRREAIHVVEQVERVRDPDEPEERDRRREDVVRHELDAQPRRDRDTGRGELRDELRERAQVPDVVEQAGCEEEAATGEDPCELPGGVDRLHRHRERDAGPEPAGDPDSTERRRRPIVPALAGRARDEQRACGGGAKEGPQGERRDRQCGDRDGRFHGAPKGSGRPERPYNRAP